MNWLSSAFAKLALNAILDRIGRWLRDWLGVKQAERRGYERGQSESDARHAKAAEEADERMRKAREQPLSDDDVINRFKDGRA